MSDAEIYWQKREAIWKMLHDAGFIALESQQDEIEHFAKEWSKAGFIHWLHQYTDGKVSKKEAVKIYDFITD